MKKSNRKWLTAIAAICSSVFLFAGCEPGDDRPAEGPADQEAPTYGEPDRQPPPPTTTDPGMQDSQADDQWEQDGTDTGTDTGMQ